MTRFCAAADTYHRRANIQRRVAKKLMALIASPKSELSRPASFARILEIGCGTGVMTKMLANAFPSARIDAVDVSRAMIINARRHLAGNRRINLIAADARCLPENEKYPLIMSNCSLHWITPLQIIIKKLGGMLEPGGILAFDVMLRGTFAELNSVRKKIAPHKPPRVTLPNKIDVLGAIRKACLTICADKMEIILLEYSSASEMLKQLHEQGVTGGNNLRGKHLLTRSELDRLMAGYSKNYKSGNKVFASYRVFYCVAVKAIRKTG